MPQRKLFDRNTKQRKRKKLDAANFNWIVAKCPAIVFPLAHSRAPRSDCSNKQGHFDPHGQGFGCDRLCCTCGGTWKMSLINFLDEGFLNFNDFA
jgi:hypothetical protein